jgi:hypothetical protein
MPSCIVDFFFILEDEIVGRRLGQCYGVLTPLFASGKGVKVLMVNNVFIQSFSRVCLGAIEETNRQGKPTLAAHGSATAVLARTAICLTA